MTVMQVETDIIFHNIKNNNFLIMRREKNVTLKMSKLFSKFL